MNKYGGINDMPNCDKRVYGVWYQMLRRCYDTTQHEREKGKSYADCEVCDRWKMLSCFAKGFLICPNTGMDIWDECYCAHGEKRIIEPQPDGIQFRTVDDLGRICIPKDIRDKLRIKPGTECAVYATDELTPDEIIVIRRK